MRDVKTTHAVAISSTVVTPFAALFVIGIATAGAIQGRGQLSADGDRVVRDCSNVGDGSPAALVGAVAAATNVADGPEMLLVSSLSILPGRRREWGEAMRSELSLVEGRPARWRFAVGCARAVLMPPTADPMLVRVAGSISATAVVAIWLASGSLTPSMMVFVVTLAAVIGAMTTVTIARGGLSYDREPVHPISLIGVAAVVASVWLTGTFLVEFPEAEEQFSTVGAVVLAVGLASIMWLAVARPERIMRSRRAVTIGMWAAIVLGAGYWVTARTVEAGTMSWALLAPWLIVFVAGAVAAMAEGSLWAGVKAAVWAVSLGTTLMFAVALPEAVRRYGLGDGLLVDGDWAPIGTNLNDAIWILIAVPVLGLPFGVFGAAVGRRLGRRRMPIASFAQISTE